MKRILIIEDDIAIAELERDFLEGEGYSVEIVAEGDQGERLALEQAYDLIVLDLMLPGKDGYNICRKIRSEKDIPILMVTAKKESLDKIRGLGLGADDYIVKPFDPMELVARVKAHLQRYERLTRNHQQAVEEEEAMHFQNLSIFPLSRRVVVGGEEVKLANKEFELLLFLANHPDIVFSKEALLDRIWGFDAIGDTATVTVHVNRIREKIEEDSSNPLFIETVWGAGYRFKKND